MNTSYNRPARWGALGASDRLARRGVVVLLVAVVWCHDIQAGAEPGYLAAGGPLELRFQAKRTSVAPRPPVDLEDAEAGLMQGPPVPLELFLRGTEKSKEEKPEPPAPLKPLPAPPTTAAPGPQVDPLGSIQPLTQDPEVVSGRILVKYFNPGPSTNGTAVLALPFGFTPPQPVQAPSSRAVYTTNPSP